jgi:hypothetical protein
VLFQPASFPARMRKAKEARAFAEYSKPGNK